MEATEVSTGTAPDLGPAPVFKAPAIWPADERHAGATVGAHGAIDLAQLTCDVAHGLATLASMVERDDVEVGFLEGRPILDGHARESLWSLMSASLRLLANEAERRGDKWHAESQAGVKGAE